GIRVNSVNPTTVDTKMVIDEQTMRHFLPDQDEPDMEDFKALMREPHILPVPWVESIDVSLPGLRRVPLRHRRGPADRRRPAHQVSAGEGLMAPHRAT
ncbi:MAG: hypothetical protein ACHQDC_11400, partial [Acidimicrobiales bacterium]